MVYLIKCCLQVDSEEEKIPEEKFVEELAKNLPQGTDKTPELLDSALKDLPDRYVQKLIRFKFQKYSNTAVCMRRTNTTQTNKNRIRNYKLFGFITFRS